VNELEPLGALRRGDERAFITLVDLHGAGMLRLARVYVRDRDVAEEVVQEAWTGMQRRVITLRDVEGWSAKEVCNVLELSETNQRVLLHGAHEGAARPRRVPDREPGPGLTMGVPELTCKELVEVITDYLEGSMPAERRLLFEEHVAFCDWCRTYLEQVRATVRLTGTLREDDLGPEARAGLLRVFRDWKAR
jgi:Putative zinc-finger